jgi:arylamine N-acetyltransferase
MSLHGMDFTPGDATPADLVAKHEHLQSAPESSFVRTLVAFRRDADGVDFLRGRVLTRLDTTGETTRELTTAPEWHACLADVFGLPLSDVDTQRKTLLWNRVTAAHETWLAGSRQ